MPRKTKEQISYNMSRIRGKGSEIEKILTRTLQANNFSYKKHYSITGKPDFVLVDKKIAIFCDSSFWHGYKFGQTNRHNFKSNKKFWLDKIGRNMKRDKEVTRTLRKEGWKVIRFWDFNIKKNPQTCADKIRSICPIK